MKTTVNDIQIKLESMIDGLFYDLQTAEGITSGDIAPFDAYRLDELTADLAKLMHDVLVSELPRRDRDFSDVAADLIDAACLLSTTGSYEFYDGDLLNYFDHYPSTAELRALVPFIKADPRVSDVTVYGGPDHFIDVLVWPDCVGVDYRNK